MVVVDVFNAWYSQAHDPLTWPTSNATKRLIYEHMLKVYIGVDGGTTIRWRRWAGDGTEAFGDSLLLPSIIKNRNKHVYTYVLRDQDDKHKTASSPVVRSPRARFAVPTHHPSAPKSILYHPSSINISHIGKGK